MKLNQNVIGFYGIENYEIILYLSRILDSIGRKVLMIDYSSLTDLKSCIPIPIGIYVETDIVTYSGIDYTKKFIDQDLIDNYDDILIYFGFNFIESVNKYCTRIVYVTDQQKHNIDRLALITETDTKIDLPKSLLIKDVVDCKITREYIIERLQKNIKKEDVFVFLQDEIDKKIKIILQYNTSFAFQKISNTVKEYLRNMVRNMCPGIAEKELKAAYKIAERGQ
jgi:hypothetical protein